MGRDETLWKDPLDFNPERFSTDMKTHPFALMIFSAGPRYCPGQKFAILVMKTIIARILLSYEVHVDPTFEPELTFKMTLRAENGIQLVFKDRC